MRIITNRYGYPDENHKGLETETHKWYEWQLLSTEEKEMTEDEYGIYFTSFLLDDYDYSPFLTQSGRTVLTKDNKEVEILIEED